MKSYMLSQIAPCFHETDKQQTKRSCPFQCNNTIIVQLIMTFPKNKNREREGKREQNLHFLFFKSFLPLSFSIRIHNHSQSLGRKAIGQVATFIGFLSTASLTFNIMITRETRNLKRVATQNQLINILTIYCTESTMLHPQLV